jgi:HEAT repeat protein
MAKIGKDHATFKILDVIRPYLKEADQEVRETAAIAMGISQMPEAIEDLIAVATDSARGRELCGRSEVDDRTRSFACYGLGLIAYATSNVDSKRKVFDTLDKVLKDTTAPLVDRNVPVAAVNAIRLVRPNAEGGDKEKKLLEDCLASLWSYWEKPDAGATDQQVQAHVPTAVAQLLGRGGDKTGKYKDGFADLLDGKSGKKNNFMYQSAALALGLLAQPEEVEKQDKKYTEALLRYFAEGKDEQARNFALLSLGKIGGDANRTKLLQAFAKGSKALEKPWAAVSLGVLAFEAAEKAGDNAVLDTAIGETLLREIENIKNDETQSSIAVALGLCKYSHAADKLEALLIEYKNRDQFAGYLCIGLALMDARESMPTIKNIVKTSVRRPDLLKQAAIALGKMGDKEITADLQNMLTDGEEVVAKLSAVSSALGFIGDQRTIDPLVKMMQDESITPLSRAFAAVALGGVADKESLPWNSKIGCNMNYRAAVETLTNGLSGVLDIL